MKKDFKKLIVSAVTAASLSAFNNLNAENVSIEMNTLGSGTEIRSEILTLHGVSLSGQDAIFKVLNDLKCGEGKCGEGKCGGAMKKNGKNGKAHGTKQQKGTPVKAKTKTKAQMKTREGKCGEAMKKQHVKGKQEKSKAPTQKSAE